MGEVMLGLGLVLDRWISFLFKKLGVRVMCV